jgi:hypothetical protein
MIAWRTRLTSKNNKKKSIKNGSEPRESQLICSGLSQRGAAEESIENVRFVEARRPGVLRTTG